MKANEAPEKIYLHIEDGKVLNRWNSEWAGLNDVEYTHTDTFIEKACEYLEPKIWAMNMGDQKFTDECIEDFKKAMKDETYS